MAAEGQSDRMASDMEVYLKQRCVIEFHHVEKIAPTDIHNDLLNISGDQIVDVRTASQWVVLFNNDNSYGRSSPLVQVLTSMACRLLFIAGQNASLMVVTVVKNTVQ